MEKKFDVIRSLEKEIQNLFDEIEKYKQTINPDRLIILNKLLDIFAKNKKEMIGDLFDGTQNVGVDETIKKLTSLKKLLQIFLELEKNLK